MVYDVNELNANIEIMIHYKVMFKLHVLSTVINIAKLHPSSLILNFVSPINCTNLFFLLLT